MNVTDSAGEAPTAVTLFDSFANQAEYPAFEQFCKAILVAEGVRLHVGDESTAVDFSKILDLPEVLGEVTLVEPGGFHRKEVWGFDFRLYRKQRLGVDQIGKAEAYRKHAVPTPHIVCFITSGEITSVLSKKVESFPWLRVWDRSVLVQLAQRHPSILTQCSRSMPEDVVLGSASLQATAATSLSPTLKSAEEKFRERLSAIPTGIAHFVDYEDAVTDVLNLLFAGQLGEPRRQNTTLDGAQRRDILFKNRRQGHFWTRVFERFGSDFLIVDAKNYSGPLEPRVLDEVVKYANDAIGRLVLLVSRSGAAPSCQREQIRIFRDRRILVVCIGDEQLVEMLRRKRQGEAPEDVLEDAVDAVLTNY